MARINLTELIADREAGTGGPWWTDGKYSVDECGVAIIAARTDCGPMPGNPTRGMAAWASEILPENADRCEANARRIARLPDLEAAYIEAVRALREMKDLLSYAGQDACNEAVAQGNKNKAWHIAHKFLGDGE